MRLKNHDILHGTILRARSSIPNLIHDIHAIDDLTENRMLAIQMGGRAQGNKELATIGARPTIGHRQRALPRMHERAVELILELAAVENGAPARAGPRWVAALDHEAWDDAVEDHVVVLPCVC